MHKKYQNYGTRQSRKTVIGKIGKAVISAAFIGVAVYFIAYGLGLDRALVVWLTHFVAQLRPT